jgi:hypothetical protein
MDTMLFLETIVPFYSYTGGGRLEQVGPDPEDAASSAILKGGGLVPSSDSHREMSRPDTSVLIEAS